MLTVCIKHQVLAQNLIINLKYEKDDKMCQNETFRYLTAGAGPIAQSPWILHNNAMDTSMAKRFNSVKIADADHSSPPVYISSGVGKGSVLGPLLFPVQNPDVALVLALVVMQDSGVLRTVLCR